LTGREKERLGDGEKRVKLLCIYVPDDNLILRFTLPGGRGCGDDFMHGGFYEVLLLCSCFDLLVMNKLYFNPPEDLKQTTSFPSKNS